MKKVLILTSERTGSGHKSSSNAIEKKLREAGYDCLQVDVFPLMGRFGSRLENSYIPVTTRAPFLFLFGERLSQCFPGIVHSVIYRKVRKGLLGVIGEYRPDLILSVHCMFTKAVSRLIRKERLAVPFYVGVIDLVDPPRVWEDKRADMSFVPTEAVRDRYLKKGFRSERVLVSGFPVRDDICPPTVPKRIGEPLQILMLNPSTDLKKNIRLIRETARLENVRIRVACGLDERLYKKLLKMQEEGELPDGVSVYGFVRNMHEHLAQCQILMTKAGPNAMIEGVRSGCAVVVTGHINGHENRNYRFILDNGYGIRCEDPGRIYSSLYELIHSGELERCLENTVSHGIGNGAEVIAEYVKAHI